MSRWIEGQGDRAVNLDHVTDLEILELDTGYHVLRAHLLGGKAVSVAEGSRSHCLTKRNLIMADTTITVEEGKAAAAFLRITSNRER